MSLNLPKKFAKYLQVLKINLNNRTTYVADFLSRAFLVGFVVWILSQLYHVTYASLGTDTVNGVTLPGVIWTLSFVHSFYLSPRPTMSKLIGNEVKSGTLAYSINKPYSYLLFNYFTLLGKTSLNLFMNVLATSLVAFILVGPIHVSFLAAVSGFILLFFGTTLDFLIMFCIGITSFWIEDPAPVTWFYSRLQLVGGGLIVPLSLLPGVVRHVMEFLPFSQNFYSAAHIITDYHAVLFWRFLLTQLIWISIMVFVSRFLFKKALKNVTINGG